MMLKNEPSMSNVMLGSLVKCIWYFSLWLEMEKFKNIVEIWGKVICLGKSSLRIESVEVMKVLIAIDIFQRINHEILFTFGDSGYRVMTKEVGTAT